MLQLFFEGGWLFMGLITLMAIAMLFFSFKCASAAFNPSAKGAFPEKHCYYIRFFGMLALVTGILGQIIGLYEAMQQIATQGGISQEVMAGGIRVSSITTLYGFIIFILAHLIWFFLDLKQKRSVSTP